MVNKDVFVLLLEYSIAWDRGDSEGCTIPILTTNDLKLAIKEAENTMQQIGLYDIKVYCYRLALNETAKLHRKSERAYYKSPLVFTCQFYGMENDKGTDMELEWVDKSLKPKPR